jgi:hypothetical protein
VFVSQAKAVSESIFANGNLATTGQTLAQTYKTAKPFPHIVIDNFLDANVATWLRGAFPDSASDAWIRYDSSTDRKLGLQSILNLEPDARRVLYELAGAEMIQFLQQLTGIDGLLADPWFRGGGLHQTLPGGFLEVHADFNKHQTLNLDRRLNVIIYLTPDNWIDEYGGHLELWDREMREAKQRILPIFNRCVVFETSATTYHGHPSPLTCPPTWSRKSLAAYFYTCDSLSSGEAEFRNTVYRKSSHVSHSGSIYRKMLAQSLHHAARYLDQAARFARRRARSLEFKNKKA